MIYREQRVRVTAKVLCRPNVQNCQIKMVETVCSQTSVWEICG